MRKLQNWAWLLLFGSLWGVNEVVVGDILSQNDVPRYSVMLAAMAFLILAIGRGVVNRPGSSAVLGIFAALFKLANAAPFFCHLLGIFMMGVIFDVFATWLMKEDKLRIFRSAASGFLSAYGSNAAFALVITYIIRYKYWVAGGLPKVIDHIFVSGSLGAAAALILVPLGFWIGISGNWLSERRPQWTYAGTVGGVVLLYTIARFL